MTPCPSEASGGTDVELLPATVEMLTALESGRTAFEASTGFVVPDGWPEFPEAVGFTIDRLRSHPDEGRWWMHFFVADGRLVGSGGFTGPPQQGVAEIGYEIAPAYRGMGLATAAARALVTLSRESGQVITVVAHTLAHPSPSTGVLTKLGFSHVGDLVSPDDGPLWRWELPSDR